MASLDHNTLVQAYLDQFKATRNDLEEIAKHLTKSKGQGILDILEQIAELLQRIETAAEPPQLEIEVARSIARDFDTIAQRWRELEQYFADEVHYDDYVYRSDEERAEAVEVDAGAERHTEGAREGYPPAIEQSSAGLSAVCNR